MTAILALDISKSGTGWAFGRPGEKPISGVHPFAGVTEDETWRSAMIWTHQQLGILNPDVVGIEAAIQSSAPGQGGFTNPKTQMVLMGLQAVIRTVVKAKLPGCAQLINVSTARKTFTGRGTYPSKEAKPAVQKRCLELGWLDFDTLEENRADALCVWAHLCAVQDPDFAAWLKNPKSTKSLFSAEA